jgi:LysM repeat protein
MYLIRLWVAFLFLLPVSIFPRQIIPGMPDQLIHAANMASTNGLGGTYMIPNAHQNDCALGAGVSDGSYNDVRQAAYNRDVICGKMASTVTATPVIKTPTSTSTISASQLIAPITRSTPDEQGRIYHVVRQGQSLWSIAIIYGTKINAILQLNNMSLDTDTLYNGERLLIPTSLTPLPTTTPTPMTSLTPVETPAPLPTATLMEGTPIPSVTPTPDPAEQAAADERFRGGLFIALVISLVLIVAGFLINRR